jgi:hypothetical protein
VVSGIGFTVADRIGRRLALVIAAFGVVVLIGAGFLPGVKPDADAYWLAAHRLREGEALYQPLAQYANEIDVYRYAPWFAYAWVPLTWLPQDVAYLIWRGILLAGAVAAGIPLVRTRTPAGYVLALLMVGLLVSALQAANVTSLIIGALALALPTRAGPVVLGLAGSLKIFPLLLVAGYIAERRLLDATVALGVAALLWVHILAFGIADYPTAFGGISFYRLAETLWPGLVALLLWVLAGLMYRRSPWSWLAAAASIPLVVPRVWIPDAAYVVPGAVKLLDALRRRAR